MTTVSLRTSGSAAGSTAASTAAFTTVANTILVFICAVENTGALGVSSVTSVVDSTGRPVTSYSRTWSPGNAASDGVTVLYYSMGITNAVSTRVITTTSNNARKAWAVYEIAGFPSGTSHGISGLNVFPQAPPYGTNSSAHSFNEYFYCSQSGDVVIGFLGVEGFTAPNVVDSDTLNGVWSTQTFIANGTTVANSVGLATQYKIGTYTGSSVPPAPTYNVSLAAAVDGLIGAIGIIQTSKSNPVAAPTVGTFPTATTIDLTWAAPYTHWTISDYLIEYRVTAVGGAWTTFDPGHVASTALTKTVTGLIGGTTYDFNIRSVNTYGTSDTGGISLGTTSVTSVSTSITATVISSVTTLPSPAVTSLSISNVPVPVVSASSTLYAITPVSDQSLQLTTPVVVPVASFTPPTILLSTIRYFRPSSDPSVGSWTVAPLWSKVDEVSPYDSDYISSEGITSGTTSIAKLALTLT